MKKIFNIILLIGLLSVNFAFADICTDCTIQAHIDNPSRSTLQVNNECATQCATTTTTTTTNSTSTTTTPPSASESADTLGIDCNADKLLNGQCKLNIYDTLGIRKTVRDTGDPTSVGIFVQDIVLSATFFIGTIVTIALIVSGLMYIFAAASGKEPTNAKKGIIGSLIGLLIVSCSYFIIRLVQYLAKGF